MTPEMIKDLQNFSQEGVHAEIMENLDYVTKYVDLTK